MFGVFNLKSAYSMLNSLIHLDDLVKKAVDESYEFVALTDNHLHGTIEFFELAKEYNVKPVLGINIKLTEPNKDEFLVYVKNQEGYKNILKLSYLKYSKQHLNLSDLIKHQKGLIIVTGGYNSILDQTILYGNEYEAIKYLEELKQIFDDFYIGISTNYVEQIKLTMPFLYELALKNNYNALLIHETTYLDNSDKETFEALLKIENMNNEISKNSNFSFLSKEELSSIFLKYPKLLDMQNKLLNSIKFDLPKIKYDMPIYETKDNIPADEYLVKLAHAGLSRRLKINKIKEYQPYVDRLNHELNIINKMNFNNYFLIVYDFVKYAKQNDVLVGPGRGSAAGSLVAYSLGITDIDPIKYNLMFERFLNPERTSMPDIDMDFPDNKRDEVIYYVLEKYGYNHIASINTFSTLQLKSSIRDIARVLKVPVERVNGIIKALDNNRIDESDHEVMEVLNTAKKIEGLYRQTGTHAAGIILSNQDLYESIPMQTGAYKFGQTQYDMDTLQKLGLIKIDFLGIRNLAIIHDILNNLKAKGIELDLNNISLDDKKTYKLLSTGNTTGIFQLESNGMKNVLRKLHPENFEDIVATLALFRPGPMANIDIYIARKKGEKFKYLHDDLIDILSPTYGIIIYQEQIMQIAQKFAGYNLFEADMLRVGVSKKDRNILEKEKNKFIDSSVKNGYSLELANKIYDYILEFANYGFNRSHSVAYGMVAYQMAYLKANYYDEFMKVLLNNVIGNESQTRIYQEEIRKHGITCLPPNINISTNEYVLVENKLVMPLTAIKGIGFKTYEDIINERNNNGNYTSFINLKQRLSNVISESQLKQLINAGALDLFGYNRNTMLINSNLTSVGLEAYIKDFVINEEKELDFNELQKLELESIGINIKYNLALILKEKINKNEFVVSELSHLDSNSEYIVCGLIESKKEYQNKNKDKMLFIDLTDSLDTISVTVFSDKYSLFNNISEKTIIKIRVKKTIYKDEASYTLIEVVK